MDSSRQDFERDLLNALLQTNKHISPKYFYDVKGSLLFDQICDLPEYYPTRTELLILKEHAADIAKHMGAKAELIELGAGSLTKVRFLLREMDSPISFLPMDISGEHLNAAAKELSFEFPKLNKTNSKLSNGHFNSLYNFTVPFGGRLYVSLQVGQYKR